MRFILVILVLIFSYAFFLKNNDLDCIMDNMVTNFSKKVYREKKYKLSGIGGGILYQKIKLFKMYFDTEKDFSIEEARECICSLAQDFLKFLNYENNRYHKHYIDNLMKTSNIDIALFSNDVKKTRKVHSVTIFDSHLMYLLEDSSKDIKIIEPLEEAIEKLEAEGKNYDYLKSMISYKKYDYREEDDPKYQKEQARLAQGSKKKSFFTKVKECFFRSF